MGNETKLRPPVVQQNGRRLDEERRLSVRMQARCDCGGGAWHCRQHGTAEAKLQEAMFQDLLYLGYLNLAGDIKTGFKSPPEI
jgi:hypothetical protein